MSIATAATPFTPVAAHPQIFMATGAVNSFICLLQLLAMLTRYAACAWLRSRCCAPHLRHPLRPGRREGIKEKE